MGRNDWIWVAIRIFGIYMLVLAAIAIPELISSALITHNLWDRPHIGAMLPADKTDPERLWNTMRHTSLAALLASLVRVIFYSALGYYLLRKGNFLFKVISRQPPPSE